MKLRDRLDGIVLATSADPSDAATAEFAAARGISCYRGPLEDVAARLLQAGEAGRAGAIVRINGDSPLLDPALVDHPVGLFCKAAAQPVRKGDIVRVMRLRQTLDSGVQLQERGRAA
jgi:spore coat polysaccharide biosynthesis protein SpsF (cytidylyltransferase family)